METTHHERASLFRHDETDSRVFLFTLAASILIHLAFVVALIFASEYNPPAPPLSAPVIDVSMVTLPAEKSSPVPFEAAASEPQPDPLTQAELEALLMQQQTPEPEPQPAPEPVVPAPEPAQEQVVIDPKEPKEPPPKPPEKKTETPPKPPEKEPAKDEVKKPAPLPVKAPKFTKPAKPLEAIEVPRPDDDSIRKAIADIQKKIAIRNKDRYRVAPEPGPRPEISSRSGGSGFPADQNGADSGETIGVLAKAAITSYKTNVLPDRINRNWAFSEHLASRRFNLEAVLVIQIRADGQILDIWFEKKSEDRYFDTSAYNAVVKSNPLPPLPKAYAAYAKTYTVGLRFTPSGIN